MGDITNVSELSIDAGHTYDATNDKLSVKNSVGLYVAASLHTLTDQVAATDCLLVERTVSTYLCTEVGSPVLTGISIEDGCNAIAPGITVTGILGVTDPADASPAVKIIGGKKSGATMGALASAETVAQVFNNATGGVAFFGDGDIATTQWTDYASTSTVVGWTTFEEKHIFYKRVGNTVFCTFYIRGASDSADTSFTLPWAAKNAGFVLAICSNVDNSSTTSLGEVFNSNGVVSITKTYGGGVGAWTASNTKDTRGSFCFELAAIV